MRHADHPLLVRLATALLASGWLVALSACSAAGGDDAPGGPSGATPSVHPPAATADMPPEAGVTLLNEYRALAGLAPVQVDEAMSAGCAGHVEYLIWESEENGKGPCFLSHTEDNHENPNYSADNEAAGKGSVIACGYGPGGDQSLGQAVDGWMNTLYHRLPLIKPGLHTIGWASKQGRNCISYRKGTDLSVKVDVAQPVLWPPDAMSDVPRTFMGFEFPCPTMTDNPLATNGTNCEGSGFIVTASWFGWGTYIGGMFTDPSTSARMFDESTGGEIPLLAWYADGLGGHDPAPDYVGESVALIPAERLPENATIRVEIDGMMKTEPVSPRWRFTTGTRDQ